MECLSGDPMQVRSRMMRLRGSCRRVREGKARGEPCIARPHQRALLGVVATAFMLAPGLALPSPAYSAKLCKQRTVGLAGEPPVSPITAYEWRVRAKRVRCGRAARVGQAANANEKTGRWRCGFSHFEGQCSKGRRRIFLRAKRPIGVGCTVPFRIGALTAANAFCSVAEQLAVAVRDDSSFGPKRKYPVDGRTWRCRQVQLPVAHISQVCFSGRSMIHFEVLD